MKLRHNLIAGFTNSVITAIIGLAVVPFYISYLGIEAYGLIGFFAALQAMFVLLDMGLAPTINREVARCSATGDLTEARDLLHTLAMIYWAVAALIAIFSYFAAPLVAEYWLEANTLSPTEVTKAVILMGLIVACRWPLGLYLGALMGTQRLTLASAINIVMFALANVGAIAVLEFVSRTIQAFFIWQAIAGLAYVLAVRAAAWHALDVSSRPRFDVGGLKRVWRFSAGMGATAILGTIFMQSDKVILSKIVSLEDLGRYTLAGLAARSLYLFLTPVFNAVYPRMTVLATENKTAELTRLYKNGTRILMAVIFPLALYVAVFSEEIFSLWTGNPALAQSVVVVVGLLMLGSAMNGAMHFPYALQLAVGRSHLAVTTNMVLIVVFIPMLGYLTLTYGIEGAAASWAALNCQYVLFGTWLTHRTVLKGEGMRWLAGDVGFPLLTSLIVVGIGGVALHKAGAAPLMGLALGALLPALAFVLIVALSPGLMAMARRLFTKSASRGIEPNSGIT